MGTCNIMHAFLTKQKTSHPSQAHFAGVHHRSSTKGNKSVHLSFLRKLYSLMERPVCGLHERFVVHDYIKTLQQVYSIRLHRWTYAHPMCNCSTNRLNILVSRTSCTSDLCTVSKNGNWRTRTSVISATRLSPNAYLAALPTSRRAPTPYLML